MPIAFSCPHCGTAMQVDDQYGGATGPCRACGGTITVPNPVAGQFDSRPQRHWLDLSWLFGLAAICVFVLVLTFMFWGFRWAARTPMVAAVPAAAGNVASPRTVDQLLRIHTALMAYQAEHGTLPPAYTVDASGKPLHSWRVLLLPYLDQDGLYRRLDLTKPWDSPENLPLLSQPDSVFVTDGSQILDNGMSTGFMAIAGATTLFPPEKGRVIPPSAGTDPRGSTILLCEVAGKNTHWAEPVDLTIDEFLALYRSAASATATVRLDGSVVMLQSYTLSDDELRKLVRFE